VTSIFSPKKEAPKIDLTEKETAYSDCLSSMIQRLPFYNKRVESTKADSMLDKFATRAIRTPNNKVRDEALRKWFNTTPVPKED
jgi:hypothetical protein